MQPIAIVRGTPTPAGRAPRLPRTVRALCAAALPLLAACVDRPVTLPLVDGPAPQALPAADCTVNVREGTMVCTDVVRRPAGAAGVRADKILGGQEVYVRLASSGTSYDLGTETLTSSVTLQNLLRQSMGTEDGTNMTPVRVFFQQSPTVTSGSGTASVVADGLDTFTASNQPFYSYSQIITPYQVSSPRTWTFSVSPGVVTFTFSVYVSAPLADYSGTLLDDVWTGAVSTDWGTGGNWQYGVAPDSASTVAIPADSMLPSHVMPLLPNDWQITNLRVGYASTLNLGTNTLRAWGNVDAVGAVTNGTLWMRGTGAVLGGNVDDLKIDGGVSLQRSVVATGAVSVSGGTLTVKDRALSIQIP